MKKSKFRLMALMMALLLTLTSCSRESSLAPAETLPPPSAPYAAPTDDTGLDCSCRRRATGAPCR